MARFSKPHMALGAFEVEVRAHPHLLDQIRPYRHIAFERGVERYFVGVVTEIKRDAVNRITVSGAGVEWWLGEDDRHGPVRTHKVYINDATHVIAADLLKREDGSQALNEGTLNAGDNVGAFEIRYETLRRAIQRLAAMTGTEYRVNQDFTFDWAGNSDLFTSRDIVLAKEAGSAEEVRYDPTTFEAAGKVYVLAQGAGENLLVRTATSALPAEWENWDGTAFQRDMVVSAPNLENLAEADSLAAAQAGIRSTENKEATVTLAQEHLLGEFDPGDTLGVYKELILEDPNNPIRYRERAYPAVSMRVSKINVQPGPGWNIKLLIPNEDDVDLTPYVDLPDATKAEVTLTSDTRAFIKAAEAATEDSRRSQQDTNRTTPAAPAGLSVAKSTYKDYQGDQRAKLQFSWTAVTTNDDGSDISDLDGYVVRYRRVTGDPETAWQTVNAPSGDTEVTAEDLPVGDTWEAQVQARDIDGNGSDWAPASPVNTLADADTTPPPKPAVPTVVAGIRQLHAQWEKDDANGDPMPNDLRWYEVHASTTSGFTPDSTTLKGEVKGTLFSFDATPGTWVVRLIAVDYAGNKSDPSDESLQATARLVETPDLEDLAVTNAKIADLVADKITTGTLSATVTLSGIIRTSTSGQRLEMDDKKFVAYRSDGTRGTEISAADGFRLIGSADDAYTSIDWLDDSDAKFAEAVGFFDDVEENRWKFTRVFRLAGTEQAINGMVAFSTTNDPQVDARATAKDTGIGNWAVFSNLSDGTVRWKWELDADNEASLFRHPESTFRFRARRTRGSTYWLTTVRGPCGISHEGWSVSNWAQAGFTLGSGSTSDGNLTYPTAWPSSADIPHCIVWNIDGNVAEVSCRSHNRDRTGCAVSAWNGSSASGDVNVRCLPMGAN